MCVMEALALSERNDANLRREVRPRVLHDSEELGPCRAELDRRCVDTDREIRATLQVTRGQECCAVLAAQEIQYGAGFKDRRF